ncbi:hypothetical protein LCGC14_1846050 [marine sediment metagenome]|uniref:Uncharacterized protein n=1 Tax=marine sediment metagenome TaxID=412755 RepID=A0A0F9GBS0_9ZZZZ
MTEEQLREAIQARAVEGKAPCKAMLDLAAETGASPGEVGRACDELNIKIKACQLGCFK